MMRMRSSIQWGEVWDWEGTGSHRSLWRGAPPRPSAGGRGTGRFGRGSEFRRMSSWPGKGNGGGDAGTGSVPGEENCPIVQSSRGQRKPKKF